MPRLSYGWSYDEDEDEIDHWKATVAQVTDYDQLHAALINWSVVLGKLALNDYLGRAKIGRRMNIISDRMKEVKPSERHYA